MLLMDKDDQLLNDDDELVTSADPESLLLEVNLLRSRVKHLERELGELQAFLFDKFGWQAVEVDPRLTENLAVALNGGPIDS
jgi:hypothetical protein